MWFSLERRRLALSQKKKKRFEKSASDFVDVLGNVDKRGRRKEKHDKQSLEREREREAWTVWGMAIHARRRLTGQVSKRGSSQKVSFWPFDRRVMTEAYVVEK